MEQLLHLKFKKALVSVMGIGLITVTSACGDLAKKESNTDKATSEQPTPTPTNQASELDFALSKGELAENSGANSDVGALSLVVPNSNGAVTYSLVAGEGDTDNAAFTISGDNLKMTASADFEVKASYSVRIEAKNAAGRSFAKPLTVSITNVNEAPTSANLSSNTLAENAGVNAVVGSLTAVDPDAGSILTYSLVAGSGDSDNASFNISGSQLRMNASANYEVKSSYTVRVQVSDADGLTFANAITINIANVNEAPTSIALSANTLAENGSPNAVVGALSAVDPDAGSTFSYSLVAGSGDTDNAAFNISGSQLRMTAPADYEAKSSYTVRVQVSDAGGLTTASPFTVNITNDNEAPTTLALSANTLVENHGTNAVVGTLSATDPDAGATLTYTLVNGTGATDNSAFNITGTSLTKNLASDFEAKSSYSVRVQVSDGANQIENSFTVNISDANDVPTLAAINNKSTLVGQSLTFPVSPADQDKRTGGLDEGLTCVTALSYQGTLQSPISNITFGGTWPSCQVTVNTLAATEASTSVTLRVTDVAGTTADQTFNFSAVSFVLSNDTVAENSAPNTVIGSLSAFSGSQTAQFSIVTGVGDDAAFQVNGSDLIMPTPANYEVKSSYSVRIRATDGPAMTERDFTVTVTDQPEAPSITLASSSAVISEGQTAIVDVTIADPDGTTLNCGTDLSYTVVNADPAHPAVASTGAITWSSTLTGCQGVISPASQDANGSATLTLVVSDGVLTDSQSFSLTVTPVDDAPVFSGSATTPEDTQVVADVSIGDIDNTLDCSLVVATSTKATITAATGTNPGTCALTIVPNLNANGSTSVGIAVNGVQATGSFTLDIQAVDDAPEVNASISTNEDTDATGTLTITDVDSSVDCTQVVATSTLATITVTGTSSPCSVAIDPNLNANGTENVSVSVGTVAASGAFSLNVSAVNDAPTMSIAAPSAVAEDTVNPTFQVTIDDVDGPLVCASALTATFASSAYGTLAVSGTYPTCIVEATLAADKNGNATVNLSLSDTIETTPGSVGWTINPVNDLPPTPSISAIDENIAAGTEVASFATTDVDGEAVTYTISGTDRSYFTLQGNKLYINYPPDFESKSSYSVTVTATDTVPSTSTQNATVSVNNLTETLSVDDIPDQIATVMFGAKIANDGTITYLTKGTATANVSLRLKQESAGASACSTLSSSFTPTGAVTSFAAVSGTQPKCALTPTLPAITAIGKETVDIKNGATVLKTFNYVVEANFAVTTGSTPAPVTINLNSATSVNTGFKLTGTYVTATGSCTSGTFNYTDHDSDPATADRATSYTVPAQAAGSKCFVVFGNDVRIIPTAASTSGMNSATAVVAPITSGGLVSVGVNGNAMASSEGGMPNVGYNFSAPSFDSSTCTWNAGKIDTNGTCVATFNVSNPCGSTGLSASDNALITYNSSSNRIDRLMARTVTTIGNTGAGGLTGSGTADCSNSGCHGKATTDTTTNPSLGYSSKWTVWYANASATTAWAVTSHTTNSADNDTATANNATNQPGWQDRILFTRPGGTSTANTPEDKSFSGRDPLNSRFYRKLTPQHFRASRAAWSGGRMPQGCSTGTNVDCFSPEKQEMLCHWIWNGAQ